MLVTTLTYMTYAFQLPDCVLVFFADHDEPDVQNQSQKVLGQGVGASDV